MCECYGDADAVIRSGDKYMFDELSEDEMASSTEVLQGIRDVPAADVAETRSVPVAPDWREEKIGVGPVEVLCVIYLISSDTVAQQQVPLSDFGFLLYFVFL